MSSTPTLKLNTHEHTIKSVTIFKSSKAEIVRHFSLNLKAGQTKVEIRGLPGSIDTHSVRVSGLGEARLHDVVCTIGVSKDTSYASDSPSEIIRLLQVKKNALESEKRVREHEADLLVNYAKTLSGEHVPPSQMSSFLESFVEQGRKNLNEITEVQEKIIAVDRQIERENEKSVSKKGNTQGEVTVILGTDNAGVVELKLTYIVSNVSWMPKYELHAKTENGKPSSTVALHYRAHVVQSTGEDWTNTSLTLSTMSSDTIAKRIPQLMPVKLRLRGPRLFGFPDNANPIMQQQQQQGGLFVQNNAAPSGGLFGAANRGSLGQMQNARPPLPVGGFGPRGGGVVGQGAPPPPPQVPAAAFGATAAPSTFSAFTNSTGGFASASVVETLETFEEIAAPEAITEPTTFVNETPVAISFSISGESTIPSDGIDHQVSVAVLPFEAKISYVAIPRIEPRVYLQCKVKNSSEYRLLAGPVSVILDDSYVSKTSINVSTSKPVLALSSGSLSHLQDVNTGENFDCTLGDDAATKVTYSRSSGTVKSDAGSFSEAQNTTTYTTKIMIYNKHGFLLPDLLVRDAIPTIDDKRAKVILRMPEGLADAKDGEEVTVKGEGDVVRVGWTGEKEGKFAWRVNVKAKDKVVLESRWELKAPADTLWYEGMAN
ncbi:hypothetical protein H0H87_011135 [Tephrocybe sp. NHM501043]|nr:hypothetical protein H0H87_011135 [Tephrocybe sp. NHM501043]